MALALALLLATGVGVGLLGGGGSLLVLPVLTQVLGQSAQEAATASLVIVTVAALAAGVGHARQRNVCWRHAGMFTAAALPAIVLGTALADTASTDALLVVFAALMLGAAFALARGRETRARRDGRTPCPSTRPLWDTGLGAAVGFLTGLLGIGGGFVVVPVLALVLGMPMHSAVGTSLAVIAGTGALGIGIHLLGGRELDLAVTGSLTLVMALGALAGSRLAGRFSEPALASAFAALLTAVALYLVASVAVGGQLA